jgi:hypothetical protein
MAAPLRRWLIITSRGGVSKATAAASRNVAVAAVRPWRSVLSDSSRNAAPVVASSLTSSEALRERAAFGGVLDEHRGKVALV